MTGLLLINLLIVLAFVALLWLISLPLRDVSIIDLFWGFGFVVIAWSTLAMVYTKLPPAIVLLVMVTLWGLRLTGYLVWRNWGHVEDRRYAAMRQKHGSSFWWVSFLTVFLLQAVLMWVISFPVQMAMANPTWHASSSGWVLLIVGCLIWLTGLLFEAIADYQMARFKSRPDSSGKVMDQGLWRYSRHPNYFGNFCIWWGIYVVACSAGAAWTIFSPILMTFLLLRVSGVTLLEKDISQRRQGYEDYVRRTSTFFPLPPKRSQSPS